MGDKRVGCELVEVTVTCKLGIWLNSELYYTSSSVESIK
jgi:hypothetical protein